MRKLLQSLQHLCDPLLESLQQVHVSLIMRKLEQNTRRDFTSVLQEGRITSSPNGNALVSAAQDTVGLFLCEAALLAHDHLVVNHDHEMRLCRAAYQHVSVHGIVPL